MESHNPTNIPNQYLGNLSGSGNYQITIILYVVGYVEKTLCANASESFILNTFMSVERFVFMHLILPEKSDARRSKQKFENRNPG